MGRAAAFPEDEAFRLALDKRTRYPYYGVMEANHHPEERTMQTQSTSTFESKPCSRCGGSGQYSYCAMYGTKCFGCNGRGWQLTKRGAAANAFYAASVRVAASDVKPGQTIMIDGVPGIAASRWLRVDEVVEAAPFKSKRHAEDEWTLTPAVSLLGVSRKSGASSWDDESVERNGLTVSHTHLVRVAQSADEKREKIAAALAYQDTLTLKGEPRKVRATEGA